MTEQATTYAYKIKYLENPTFDKVRGFAKKFIDDLPTELVDELYSQLERDVVKLDAEPQMLVYLYSFGKMLQARLNVAFSHIPEVFFEQPQIRIVDYGCGQAIGTMCYADFIAARGFSQTIKSVTLIEPSEICLKRAALHISQFFPDAEIHTICKTFDNLTTDDLAANDNIPTLHIISNVLDIQKFDLEQFANLINNNLSNYNQFVCVGPYFSYSDKDERMTKFAELINGNITYSKNFEKGEIQSNKTLTAQIVCFYIGELEEELSTEVTDEEIKNGIKDEFGVVYSRDGKRLLKGNKKRKIGTYSIKKGTQVICDGAFSWCKYLKQITIPDSVTSIGDLAFFCCESLKQITIPDSVTSIGDCAFRECYSLEQITIPDSVTSIGNRAFFVCRSLQQITIPDSVTSIGNWAFSNCESLKQITIPDSVTSIGDCAFRECYSLEQITIPDSVTSIGDSAFSECCSLEQITIPDLVTCIGEYAFELCSSLQQITIPDSVTSIGKFAFSGCTSLQQITISDSLTSIGDGAFGGCVNINLKSNSKRFTITDKMLIDNIERRLISYFETDESLLIPNSVTSIGNWVFSWCESLQQITFPDSVTSIGEYACQGCSSLQQITFPDSLTSIGILAFSFCNSLQQIIIPEGSTEKFKKMLPKYLLDDCVLSEKSPCRF